MTDDEKIEKENRKARAAGLRALAMAVTRYEAATESLNEIDLTELSAIDLRTLCDRFEAVAACAEEARVAGGFLWLLDRQIEADREIRGGCA